MLKGLATGGEVINVFLSIMIGAISLTMLAPEIQGAQALLDIQSTFSSKGNKLSHKDAQPQPNSTKQSTAFQT